MVKMEVRNTSDLRLLIASNGMNLRTLSKEINISQSYLSLIINRKRTPSPIIAKKISEVLGKEVNDIFLINIDNKR